MTPDRNDEPLAGKRAAVMIGPLFEDAEAIYPLYRLREAGAAAADDRHLAGEQPGLEDPRRHGRSVFLPAD